MVGGSSGQAKLTYLPANAFTYDLLVQKRHRPTERRFAALE
jgi:hypothetical protein